MGPEGPRWWTGSRRWRDRPDGLTRPWGDLLPSSGGKIPRVSGRVKHIRPRSLPDRSLRRAAGAAVQYRSGRTAIGPGKKGGQAGGRGEKSGGGGGAGEEAVRRASSSRACARSRRRSRIHPGRPTSEAMAAPATVATRITTTSDVSTDQNPNRSVTGPAFWTANSATRIARMREKISAACPMIYLRCLHLPRAIQAAPPAALRRGPYFPHSPVEALPRSRHPDTGLRRFPTRPCPLRL